MNTSMNEDRLHSGTTTPLMNSILEEDDISISPEKLFNTPNSNDFGNLNRSYSNRDDGPAQPRPLFASPTQNRQNNNNNDHNKINSLYSSKDGNNSSSSIIYNPTFTFGESTTDNTLNTNLPTHNSNIFQNNDTFVPLYENNSPTPEEKRHSLKYVPSPQLAPPTSRSRSPVRTRSPVRIGSPERLNSRGKRNSLIFAGSAAQNVPTTSASRTSFRKGHRYKHSSVSMNFFQEPEIKIPLNIAKSLPIPDFNDLTQNFVWPKAHFQLTLTLLQLIFCALTFQLGHSKSWNNFTTLSHFMTYDILGSIAIILVENLSQFEVWSTGTLTFPLGLNRIDVLISFALAVSLCFVGLDLIFHIAEEFIVLFVEVNNHDELASTIPHSHHKEGNIAELLTTPMDAQIWYTILVINLLLSSLSLHKIFYTNKNSRLKTKNPIITIIYTIYLMVFPGLISSFSSFSDYISTFTIAIFILAHGLTIAQWTSTILLMGCSTTALPTSSLLQDATVEDTNNKSFDGIGKDNTLMRKNSLNVLPVAIKKRNKSGSLNNLKNNDRSIVATLSFWKKQRGGVNEAMVLKSTIKEKIESLEEFKNRCVIKDDQLVILKVNFDLYIVMIKINLKGGSSDEELKLRVSTERVIQKFLPSSETTIEIDRI